MSARSQQSFQGSQQDAQQGSLLAPVRVGTLRKGMYIQIRGRPCKIVQISVSKTGKHGHAKTALLLEDQSGARTTQIFTPAGLQQLLEENTAE